MPKSPTKRSTPKLSEIAKHVVAPKGVVSTGWPAVESKCAELGIRFRPWQPDVGRLILAKRADGKYAATIGGTGLSIPRQVGKTFLVGAIVFALCLLRPNLTVIWTAHRLRTAEETFGKMQVFAKRKSIKPFVSKIILGSGDEAILFRNGSRILFGARERGFGRGFDSVDVLIFDEAQILTENALDDMVPATNQSRQSTSALLLFMGTPPKPSDPGEVFTRMRTEALTGEDDDTGWIEFGADDNFEPTALPAPLATADWEQVAKANPSYPQDTPREAILRMRKKLGPESFVREGFGIWDNDTPTHDVFGPGAWLACRQRDIEEPEPVAIALSAATDASSASIAAAGQLEDGKIRVGAVDRRAGTAWLLDEAVRISRERAVVVVVDEKDPAADLIDDLKLAGVPVTVTKTGDYLDACAALFRGVQERTISHGGTDDLDADVAVAQRRMVGERWAWAYKDVDVSMLKAATLAAWGIENAQGVILW